MTAHASQPAPVLPIALGGEQTLRAKHLPPRAHRHANSQTVRMRERVAEWLRVEVPPAVLAQWGAAMQLSRARMRSGVDIDKCHANPTAVEWLCFLPEPYRSGLMAALAEWAEAIEKGEL